MPTLSPIQLALALEATANIFGATCMLLFPHSILSYVTARPSSASLQNQNPDQAAIDLFRWVGAIVYGLTPQLLLALPDSKGASDRRWIAYVTLGAGEGALMAVMLWQALMMEGEEGGGITKKALLGCVAGLAPFGVWRGWVLGVRPGLLGVTEGKRE